MGQGGRKISRVGRARLTRSDWVLAGFRALLAGGPEAIRIEPIARDLGATKGSFYWHFKDQADLRAAMLAAWEALASTEVTAELRRSALAPRDRVLELAARVADQPAAEAEGQALEPAVRDWGRVDPMARRVLERVDTSRIGDLRDFLAEAGLPYMRAAAAAVRFYAAVIGLENLRITCGVQMGPPLRAVAEDILGQAA